MKKLRLRLLQTYILCRYLYFMAYCKLLKIQNSDVWLISERGDGAQDNGFRFFEYMKKHHPEIKCKYVISKQSTDIGKLETYKNDLVYLASKQHFIYFITAGKLISTHIMGFSPEFRIFRKLDLWKKLNLSGKRIFLQHGITKDLSDGLSKDSTNLDIFICGAKPEYKSLLKHTGYTKNELKYTGMARYDGLENTCQNYLLIMPTWRMNLFYCKKGAEFENTGYFKAWSSILSNKSLLDTLRQKKLKIKFYPHYEIQPHIKSFQKYKNDVVEILSADGNNIQNLLNGCKMLITDYSSVFFDIAYLHKPEIYYQFDYGSYRQNHFQEGWFNYERNGFGPVVNNGHQLTKEIYEYIANNFSVQDKYKKRLESVFTWQDHGNCKRIYDAIVQLEKTDAA